MTNIISKEEQRWWRVNMPSNPQKIARKGFFLNFFYQVHDQKNNI
jgi:hypothetical protein